MAIDNLGGILVKLGAVAVLIGLNAFFVAAEFAFVKVRATQLQTSAERGDRRARSTLHILDHLDAYLSAAQVGITLTSLALGWIGEPAVASLIEPGLVSVGLGSPAIVQTVAFVIAFALITFVHITIGEQVPKSMAIQRAEGTALHAAAPMRAFYALFRPFIWLVNASSNLMLRGLGFSPAGAEEAVQSEEELVLMLSEAGRSRAIAKSRAEVVLRVFELKDLEARHVMTPRTRVVALDARKSFEENMAIAEEAQYSRFPVIDGDLEHVIGLVHYRDLVALSRRPKRDLAAIKRGVLFVPESQSVENLLSEMLRRNVHMAIVTDEFGSTAGIVTLEDVFEELFGEIRDEFDTHELETTVKDLGEGHYVLDGLMPLHRASALLRMPMDNPDVTTLSGYVVAQIGRLPTKGERVRLGRYEGVVREVDRRRIQTLELWPAEDPAESAE